MSDNIRAKAETFKQKTRQICDQAERQRTAQDATAQLLQAFAPHSILTERDVDDCHKVRAAVIAIVQPLIAIGWIA
ncbi:hypothetical protein [Xanthomonas fragariae]|uniref:hypothetical protein n=1 Tax=Xanthomonas fragariae TaxID=48664 RepID=UPI0022AA2562|nr:hypothetical protein [Xanthomonas fragariae]WAT16373.1 hypothetical protein OZ429_09080 [Xanthomonas fragariae]